MISGIGKSEDYGNLLLPLTAKIEKQKQQGHYKEAFVLNKKLMHLMDSITELNRAKMLIEMQKSYKLENKLKQLGFKSAIFEVDARSFNDMSQLVQALLFSIDPGLEYSA